VLVEDEAAGLGVLKYDDAKEVGQLTFEAAGRKRQFGQRWHLRTGPLQGNM
jgi:hypothetical protein